MNNGTPLVGLHEDVPYGHMLTDTLLLLHEPLRPRSGIGRVFYGSKRMPRRLALGALWDVQPRNIDVLPEAEILQLAERVSGLLYPLPIGSVFEVRLDRRAVYAVPAWTGDREGLDHPSVEWQRAHIAAGMPHHPDPRPLQLLGCTVTVGLRIPLVTKLHLDVREWCTLAQFWHNEQLAALFHAKMRSVLKDEIARFETHAAALISGLRVLAMAPRRLDGQGIVERIRPLLNPFATTPLVYHPAEPIGRQVALEEGLCSHPLGFRVGTEAEAHVFSLIRPPQQTYPGVLCTPRTPQGTRYALNVPTLGGAWPLSLVVQSRIADQQRLKATFESKQKYAKRQTVGDAGQQRADIEGQEADLHLMVDEMSRGRHVYPTGVHVIVWGPPAPVRPLDEEIIATGIGYGLQWYQERAMANTLFFRTLPLGCDPTYPHENQIKRHMSLRAGDVAQFMPLWGSFRGTRGREPQMLTVNRRGEDVLWNPFDATPPHVCVVGTSGSGKSYLINNLLDQTLPLGVTAIILDRFGSYKDLCALHHGTHISLTVEHPICLGPFDGPLDALHQENLTFALGEMCAGGKAHQALSQEKTIVLGQLIQAWVARGDTAAERPLTSFAQFVERYPLPKVEAFCDQLLLLLSDYYGHGKYAAFVDGRNALALAHGLWSIDMAPLKNSPALTAVLTAILFDRIERYVSQPENYARLKYVILDEVAFLLESLEAATAIERHARALRRMRSSLVTISQNPSDFDLPVGKVILNNAGSRVFLRLGREEAVKLVEHAQLPPHFVDLITDLKQYEDCAEALLCTEGGESGILRIVPNPTFLLNTGQAHVHRLARERMRAPMEVPA